MEEENIPSLYYLRRKIPRAWTSAEFRSVEQCFEGVIAFAMMSYFLIKKKCTGNNNKVCWTAIISKNKLIFSPNDIDAIILIFRFSEWFWGLVYNIRVPHLVNWSNIIFLTINFEVKRLVYKIIVFQLRKTFGILQGQNIRKLL